MDYYYKQLLLISCVYSTAISFLSSGSKFVDLSILISYDGKGLTSNITTTINTDERAMQACDCRAWLFVFIRSHVAPKGGDPSLSPSHIHPD
ncbi:hypothetical protein ANTRET_LOCUS771 [Anthophora retusa]